MTNEMIVLLESVKLMEEGIIKGTGDFMTTDDGRQLEIPEEIHTFQAWKAKGFSVKKGEKAVASFPVWKYITGKKKGEEAEAESTENEETNGGYCRMKLSHFFTRNQVEESKRAV